jgi:hypothetical protein
MAEDGNTMNRRRLTLNQVSRWNKLPPAGVSNYRVRPTAPSLKQLECSIEITTSLTQILGGIARFELR